VVFDRAELVVGVEHEIAGGLVRGLAVAGRAAPLQDRLDVAEVLYRDGALGDPDARLVLRVPGLAGLVFRLRRDERRLRDQVPDLVVGLRGRRLLEERRFLAVRVAAAAVHPDLAG